MLEHLDGQVVGDLGQVEAAGGPGARARWAIGVGQEVGQLGDQATEVARVTALPAALELGPDDVEAALHDPADVGKPPLGRLGLVTEGPDAVQGPAGQAVEQVGIGEVVERRRHGVERTAPIPRRRR